MATIQSGGEVDMPAVAMVGKLIGCYAGARTGGLSHWEGVAIGFGMNARGVVEIVVAMAGLLFGVLAVLMVATRRVDWSTVARVP